MVIELNSLVVEGELMELGVEKELNRVRRELKTQAL